MTQMRVMKMVTGIAVKFGVLVQMTACAQTPARADNRQLATSDLQQSCTISDQDREALLNLDYQSFDQSLPDGGWRKYQQCEALTRDLIDAYTAKHASTLEKQQWDVLVWHSGQLSGFLGDYADAIAKMEQTLKPAATDFFLWNPYVEATVAFLNKDEPTLRSERKKLSLGTSPYNRLNLRKVDAFIRCFHSTYKEAYSDTCEPKETNIDRIRSLAIPFHLNRPLPGGILGIRDFLGSKKVILVGEIHGTRTVPELFGNIVASLASNKERTLVILEINQSSQSSIDEFVKTGDERALKKDPFFSRDYQDGRSSRAMVDLIRKLSTLSNVIILCMDPMNGTQSMTGQARDTGMATFINSNRVGFDRVLVLSGNIHSRTTLGTPWDKTYRPMGYEFKNMATDLKSDQLLNILVRCEKVDSWNCDGAIAASCKARYGKSVSTDYSAALSAKSYFLWENEMVDGHNAAIFVRSTKISFPFLNSKNEATD